MTDDQRVKMELLKDWAYKHNLSNITLFKALRQHQADTEEGMGPAIDRLYAKIEKGEIR